MLKVVSPREAIEYIDAFCLGAVMQEDPYLEQFGSLPDEPPDEDPCWDAAPDREEKPKPMEQGLLFDFPTPSPKGDQASAHPQHKAKPTARTDIPAKPSALKPYVPAHIPYRQWLDIFCGDSTLALFYFNHQAIKE